MDTAKAKHSIPLVPTPFRSPTLSKRIIVPFNQRWFKWTSVFVLFRGQITPPIRMVEGRRWRCVVVSGTLRFHSDGQSFNLSLARPRFDCLTMDRNSAEFLNRPRLYKLTGVMVVLSSHHPHRKIPIICKSILRREQFPDF